MALATAKSVRLIDMDTGQARSCHNPWLNQGHTVEFSPTERNSWLDQPVSTRFLNLIRQAEMSFGSGSPWDHGFDRSNLGHYVVRSAARYRALDPIRHEVLLVDDPAKYEFGIPTRRKPAHLNSAGYDSDGKILITLFHQGGGYVVDRYTGEARQVISGLINPHKLSGEKAEDISFRIPGGANSFFWTKIIALTTRSASRVHRGSRDRHSYRSTCRMRPS